MMMMAFQYATRAEAHASGAAYGAGSALYLHSTWGTGAVGTAAGLPSTPLEAVIVVF